MSPNCNPDRLHQTKPYNNEVIHMYKSLKRYSMKKLFFLATFLLFLSAMQAKEKTIECPPFIVSNTSVIEIEKIVMSNTATVLYIKAFFRPKNWIQISKKSHLTTNTGERYNIKYAEGITPGEKFWMPESGETSFSMSFEPIPASTESIDFTEGEGESFWSIWGIQLKSKKLPKTTILKELMNNKVNFNTPLPTPEIKKGKAILSGRLLEYREGLKAQASFTNILDCEYIRQTIQVNKDGTFKTEFDLIAPAVVNIQTGDGKGIKAHIAPGEETNVTINLSELCRSRSKLRKDEKPEGAKAYFNGYMAGINTEALNSTINTELYDDFYAFMKEIDGMNAEQCKTYLLNKHKELISKIDKSKCSENYKKILHTEADISTLRNIYTASSLVVRAHIINNKLKNEEANEYSMKNMVKVPDEFFDCLKDFSSINTPTALYASEYPYTLRVIQMMKSNARELFSKILQTDKGVLFDFMTVQKICSQINDFQTITEEQQKEIEQLSVPVLKELILEKNALLLARIEENKKKTGYTLNEAGEVSNEDLFYSIVSKFKGKTVLVDIWATWCGPCRTAMKQMLPMKEDLKDKDIVYVYIAGENSPLKTWENMITDIHGEHYRITKEQWDYLYKEFKIQGVPTYIVLDKESNVTYKTAGFPGVNKMTEELLKTMNK